MHTSKPFAWWRTQTGEIRTIDLVHNLDKVREFYKSPPEPAIIDIEAYKSAFITNLLNLKSVAVS